MPERLRILISIFGKLQHLADLEDKDGCYDTEYWKIFSATCNTLGKELLLRDYGLKEGDAGPCERGGKDAKLRIETVSLLSTYEPGDDISIYISGPYIKKNGEDGKQYIGAFLPLKTPLPVVVR